MCDAFLKVSSALAAAAGPQGKVAAQHNALDLPVVPCVAVDGNPIGLPVWDLKSLEAALASAPHEPCILAPRMPECIGVPASHISILPKWSKHFKRLAKDALHDMGMVNTSRVKLQLAQLVVQRPRLADAPLHPR